MAPPAHSVCEGFFIWCNSSSASEVVVRDPLAEPSDLIRSVSRALRVLESVGRAPRGLTVKQIARRCELTVATTYHLVRTDRKSTRLNSSHANISYAVFCLKKKQTHHATGHTAY